MYDYVQRFTLQYWADDFVTELLTQEDNDHELLSLVLPAPLPRPELLEAFGRTSRRLIILGLLGMKRQVVKKKQLGGWDYGHELVSSSTLPSQPSHTPSTPLSLLPPCLRHPGQLLRLR
jgi:hypothetical protein